jgi:hypothetical protein
LKGATCKPSISEARNLGRRTVLLSRAAVYFF